jgi:hypothetical protein
VGRNSEFASLRDAANDEFDRPWERWLWPGIRLSSQCNQSHGSRCSGRRIGIMRICYRPPPLGTRGGRLSLARARWAIPHAGGSNRPAERTQERAPGWHALRVRPHSEKNCGNYPVRGANTCDLGDGKPHRDSEKADRRKGEAAQNAIQLPRQVYSRCDHSFVSESLRYSSSARTADSAFVRSFTAKPGSSPQCFRAVRKALASATLRVW